MEDQSAHAARDAVLTFEFDWELGEPTGVQFDLDAVALLLDADGTLPSPQHYVYWNTPRSPDGAVVVPGDDESDDCTIQVDLRALDPAVERILLVLTIYDADKRRQSFGQLGSWQVRCTGQHEPLHVVTTATPGDEATAMVVAGVSRHRDGATITPQRLGYPSGVVGLARGHGLIL